MNFRWSQVKAFVGAVCAQQLMSQRENWPSWLAIGLMAGILAYFNLPVEPALVFVITLPLLAALAVATSLLVRALWALRIGAITLLIASIGFSAAALRSREMTPHFIDAPMQGAYLTGRVGQVEPLPTGVRLTLSPAYLGKSGRDNEADALRLQITVLSPSDNLQPGQWVRLRADLHPPAGPAMPGAFDFREQAFFAGVDAVGFAFSAHLIPSQVDESTDKQSQPWLGDWADQLRQHIAQRIAEILPNESGALAIALVVGNQTALHKADMASMRDSGLSHLLSISGLHISLAAGLVFVTCRFMFALIPWLALRIATKKWAAILALLGATFYALLAGAAEPSLSGSVVPTQRSLLMAVIAFSAILLDRSPISLRLVAWSAIVLLLWQPESLIGPSFQMSFAAVFALIAGFDALRPYLTKMNHYLASPPADLAGRLIGYGGYSLFWLFSMVLSSLIASLATAPFGLYHFNRLQIYGIAANMLAVPLTGFWLMPMAVIALLLMPLGLDAPFWHLLGWGCDAVLWIGRAVQHWPQAVIPVSAMPGWGLLAASAGLLWMCLARGWARLAGLIGFAAMLISIVVLRQPDILISETGRLLAMQSPSQQLVVTSNRAERRTRETWLHLQAQQKSDTFDRSPDAASWVTCDYATNCDAKIKGRRVIFDLGRVSSAISCSSADLIIVPQRRIFCPTDEGVKPIILDQRSLADKGAVSIYLDPDTTRIESTAEAIGKRPWSAFTMPTPGNDNGDDGNPDADQ